MPLRYPELADHGSLWLKPTTARRITLTHPAHARVRVTVEDTSRAKGPSRCVAAGDSPVRVAAPSGAVLDPYELDASWMPLLRTVPCACTSTNPATVELIDDRPECGVTLTWEVAGSSGTEARP
jgi:hypothetical protein